MITSACRFVAIDPREFSLLSFQFLVHFCPLKAQMAVKISYLDAPGHLYLLWGSEGARDAGIYELERADNGDIVCWRRSSRQGVISINIRLRGKFKTRKVHSYTFRRNGVAWLSMKRWRVRDLLQLENLGGNVVDMPDFEATIQSRGEDDVLSAPRPIPLKASEIDDDVFEALRSTDDIPSSLKVILAALNVGRPSSILGMDSAEGLSGEGRFSVTAGLRESEPSAFQQIRAQAVITSKNIAKDRRRRDPLGSHRIHSGTFSPSSSEGHGSPRRRNGARSPPANTVDRRQRSRLPGAASPPEQAPPQTTTQGGWKQTDRQFDKQTERQTGDVKISGVSESRFPEVVSSGGKPAQAAQRMRLTRLTVRSRGLELQLRARPRASVDDIIEGSASDTPGGKSTKGSKPSREGIGTLRSARLQQSRFHLSLGRKHDGGAESPVVPKPFPKEVFFENGLSLQGRWTETLNVSLRAYPDDTVLYWSMEDLPASPTVADSPILTQLVVYAASEMGGINLIHGARGNSELLKSVFQSPRTLACDCATIDRLMNFLISGFVSLPSARTQSKVSVFWHAPLRSVVIADAFGTQISSHQIGHSSASIWTALQALATAFQKLLTLEINPNHSPYTLTPMTLHDKSFQLTLQQAQHLCATWAFQDGVYRHLTKLTLDALDVDDTVQRYGYSVEAISPFDRKSQELYKELETIAPKYIDDNGLILDPDTVPLQLCVLIAQLSPRRRCEKNQSYSHSNSTSAGSIVLSPRRADDNSNDAAESRFEFASEANILEGNLYITCARQVIPYYTSRLYLGDLRLAYERSVFFCHQLQEVHRKQRRKEQKSLTHMLGLTRKSVHIKEISGKLGGKSSAAQDPLPAHSNPFFGPSFLKDVRSLEAPRLSDICFVDCARSCVVFGGGYSKQYPRSNPVAISAEVTAFADTSSVAASPTTTPAVFRPVGRTGRGVPGDTRENRGPHSPVNEAGGVEYDLFLSEDSIPEVDRALNSVEPRELDAREQSLGPNAALTSWLFQGSEQLCLSVHCETSESSERTAASKGSNWTLVVERGHWQKAPCLVVTHHTTLPCSHDGELRRKLVFSAAVAGANQADVFRQLEAREKRSAKQQLSHPEDFLATVLTADYSATYTFLLKMITSARPPDLGIPGQMRHAVKVAYWRLDQSLLAIHWESGRVIRVRQPPVGPTTLQGVANSLAQILNWPTLFPRFALPFAPYDLNSTSFQTIIAQEPDSFRSSLERLERSQSLPMPALDLLLARSFSRALTTASSSVELKSFFPSHDESRLQPVSYKLRLCSRSKTPALCIVAQSHTQSKPLAVLPVPLPLHAPSIRFLIARADWVLTFIFLLTFGKSSDKVSRDLAPKALDDSGRVARKAQRSRTRNRSTQGAASVL